MSGPTSYTVTASNPQARMVLVVEQAEGTTYIELEASSCSEGRQGISLSYAAKKLLGWRL
jgi:hypothetical protein